MTFDDAKLELIRIRSSVLPVAELRERAVERINKIRQPHRDLLNYRYIRALSWREVSELMEYSVDHLRGYMNKRAIEEYLRIAESENPER